MRHATYTITLEIRGHRFELRKMAGSQEAAEFKAVHHYRWYELRIPLEERRLVSSREEQGCQQGN